MYDLGYLLGLATGTLVVAWPISFLMLAIGTRWPRIVVVIAAALGLTAVALTVRLLLVESPAEPNATTIGAQFLGAVVAGLLGMGLGLLWRKRRRSPAGSSGA